MLPAPLVPILHVQMTQIFFFGKVVVVQKVWYSFALCAEGKEREERRERERREREREKERERERALICAKDGRGEEGWRRGKTLLFFSVSLADSVARWFPSTVRQTLSWLPKKEKDIPTVNFVQDHHLLSHIC